MWKGAWASVADIVDLILADHTRIREMFAELDHTAGSAREPGADGLGTRWKVLADLLETHVDAAEEIFCLALFADADHGRVHRAEITADHDDIREAVGEARFQPSGSRLWWNAVRAARAAAADAMEAVECGPLPAFRHRASRQRREMLGGQWQAFITARARDEAAGLDR